MDWRALEGQEFYGEYLAKTDPLGAQDVANPVSHVAYGYATHVCVLNDDGTIREIDAAHFVGKAINPLSCEGQIEGGVTMALGFTLTEHYPLYDCIPSARFGTLGLFRADQVPAHPQHSGGEGGAGHGLRCHRHRRDHDHSDGSCRGGRVLRARRRDAHQPSADENAV